MRIGRAAPLATAALALAVVSAACASTDESSQGRADPPQSEQATTAPSPALFDATCDADDPVPSGSVASAELVELSGLAAGRSAEGVLWAHNDSGDRPRLFALGLDGSDRGAFEVEGADAVDWEDMAAGPGPDGSPHLFVADVGDNAESRPEVAVYRIPEPSLGSLRTGGPIEGAERLTLTYPDGPHDAEALLVDPDSGDLYLVAKVAVGPAGVYRAPAEVTSGTPTMLERVGTVPLGPGRPVTGGDVAADGSVVLLRTYGSVVAWPRAPGSPLTDAFEGEPCEAPSTIEAQGEAVAWLADDRGYVAVSEGVGPTVNLVEIG